MGIDEAGPGTGRGALVVLCLFALTLGVPYVQCLGDDTFIYMRVIENFLRSGQIEFNPGEPCYLVTSPTWFFLWAGTTKLLGNIDLARYVLSALFHVLAFFSTWLVARRLIRNGYVRLITLAVAFLDPFYLRWMWAGWETGMKITMASLSLWALLRLTETARRRGVFLAGLCIGLAFLTRPEMMVLIGLGLVYLLVKFPRRRSRLVPYATGVVVVTLPWMLHAYATFGWAMPHTVFAMSGSQVDLRYLSTNGVKFVQVVGGPLLVSLLMLAFSLALRLRRSTTMPAGHTRVDDERARLLDWLLVATWGLAVTGYVITGSIVVSIYTGLFVPALAIAVGGAVERLSAPFATRWMTRGKAAAFLGLAILVSVGIQSKLYYRYSLFNPRYRDGVDAHFVEFATKIKELTEPSDEVGLWELGVIGYFSERYIVDFAGLATPEIVTYMRKHDRDFAERFLEDRGRVPRFIVKQYRKGEDAGRESSPRTFFGLEYQPIWSQKVQRVGGSVPRDHYDLYVLYWAARGRDTPGTS